MHRVLVCVYGSHSIIWSIWYLELVAFPKTERVCEFEESFHLQIDRSRVVRKFQPQGLPRTSPEVTMRKAGVGSQFGGFRIRSVDSLEERNYRDKRRPQISKIHPPWWSQLVWENVGPKTRWETPTSQNHWLIIITPPKMHCVGQRKTAYYIWANPCFILFHVLFPTKSQLLPSAWRQQHS